MKVVNNASDLDRYIFCNDPYPFKEDYNFLIVNTIDDEVLCGLQEILVNSKTLKMDNQNTIIFYIDSFDYSIEEIISLLNDDFGKNLKINTGYKINKDIVGSDIFTYYLYAKEYLLKTRKSSSSFLSLVCSEDITEKGQYINLIKNVVINKLLVDERNKEIITFYFKNNLNVLKTSQELYTSRSSLLFRFKSIKKNFGIDLQSLEDICGLYCLIN